MMPSVAPQDYRYSLQAGSAVYTAWSKYSTNMWAAAKGCGGQAPEALT